MIKQESLFELIGVSKLGECNGHVWQGEGRCPYCSNPQLSSERNQEIITKSLEILDAALSKGAIK